MCLAEVQVLHRPPHPHRPGGVGFPAERIERGGQVIDRHDALPRVVDGVWMTSTTRRSHCRSPRTHIQASRCPHPQRSLYPILPCGYTGHGHHTLLYVSSQLRFSHANRSINRYRYGK
jgi:hypothetical protein